VYKTEYAIGLIHEVLEYVEKNNFLRFPAIAIYYYGYLALTNPIEEHYFKNLKETIFEYGHLFSHSEVRDIYLMAINYCIGRMNAGEKSYIRETFELYREGLKKEILFEENQLSRWTFLNIVSTGANLEEYDWVENFIHQYQDYLGEKHRQSFVHYSLARLNFERKDYTSAMRLLVQADYDDILINLNAKTMLFKMYYEQDELNALESLLESMRTYMQRKKVIGYHKANYRNIIQFTKKLVRINPYDEKGKKTLKKEIEAANPLTERKWILEQLEKL
ncbi:MAG: hypothetical protein GY705_26285, partial [Bacteroidetes bacterium]|nr:hypothetical protein [Bacteroidota bacterium]